MNGEMIEARLQRVDWSDVSVDTFARLCEFAYLQDYTPPAFQQSPHFSSTSPSSQPFKNHEFWDDWDLRKKKEREAVKKGVPPRQEIIEPEPEPAPFRNHEFWDGWEEWSPLQRKRKKKEAVMRGIPPLQETVAEPEPEPEPETETPAPEFEDDMNGTIHAFELPLKQRNISEKDLQGAFVDLEYFPPKSAYQFKPNGNGGPTQDFTHVLVGHAELYIIADKYGIESLRQLVLHKLHQTLKSFTVYETDVVCIAEFLRFVYHNTPPDNGKIDPLRNLASRYVVSILGQIGDIEAFKQLLVEGGDFVIDFWHLIWTADRPSRSVYV
jgi:hypothetical protein